MQHVLALVSAYGVFILLPIMIVEGPIITIIASFLAYLGYLNIFVVYILALLGNIIGDFNYYAIGRFDREKFIHKYGKYIGLHEKNIEKLERHYERHFYKTILFAKVTEAPIIPTLVAAGLARVNLKKYMLLSTAIEIPKVLIVVLIGYFFGKFYNVIGRYFQDTVLAVGVSLVGAILVFFLYTRLRQRSS